MLNRIKHVEAEIYYLTPEEGGRRTPLFSGYLGQFYYDGQNWDSEQIFETERVTLGQWVTAFVGFASPKHIVENFGRERISKFAKVQG